MIDRSGQVGSGQGNRSKVNGVGSDSEHANTTHSEKVSGYDKDRTNERL